MLKSKKPSKAAILLSKKRNVFTKVKMDFEADAVLLKYFSDKLNEIEDWFNIMAPEGKNITELKNKLIKLRSKNWKEIL